MKTFILLLCVLLSQPVVAVSRLAIQQVAPGIYVHFGKHELPDSKNHGAIANIGFIVGQDCVAVIDTGGNPQQGWALKKAIKNTTDKPVCYVVNTHVHPDHIYGNIAFKSPKVKFIGHHKLARAMATRGTYYIDKAADQLAVKLTEKNIIPPDLPVKTQLQIDLGGRILTLTAHPSAHTDNDLSVYDEKTNTLWLSDLLFREHLPVIDGSILGWLRELNRLEKNHYAVVIPGHGAVVKDWPKAMQPEKAYLQMLVKEIRQFIKQGKYLEQAVKEVGYSAKDQWSLFDQFHRKNITTAFAELEWED